MLLSLELEPSTEPLLLPLLLPPSLELEPSAVVSGLSVVVVCVALVVGATVVLAEPELDSELLESF